MSTSSPLPFEAMENNGDATKMYFSETANWIVPRTVMVGESPYMASSVKERMASLCIEGGVTTFVCLQAEVPPQPHDCMDFGGVKDEYEDEVSGTLSYSEVAKQIDNIDSNLKFVYYGICDFEPARSLQELDILIEDLANRVANGEVLYIHCKGGVGRSGLVGACVLGKLYPELSAEGVLERIQQCCRTRWSDQNECKNIHSPETEAQSQQVRDYITLLREKQQDIN
mmetsp:Transcript_13996/g.17687  ORF Transcript_13996/g.17687 Transcript_13996/m.17687 type:complete len:227 (-) Transcript_13996:200-880(-)|eukprot:CAMPEP_0203635232 /NCGR_PEP_ID=MMETSP0088-20131115/2056_1 /ASSEMBLY_ACC=CAM_ASM_001087 /TAXON_ID=426623 /ORGANISM="Chaetoceros affinis, Strain CCMP159" /LENGTH=226 /DNA_ID=CAMNT_0050489051 /DNA_START=49 /DNA_END=729 /DNA_ORIENTATION=+